MSSLRLAVTTVNPEQRDGDCTLLLARATPDGSRLLGATDDGAAVDAMAQTGFTAGVDEVLRLPAGVVRSGATAIVGAAGTDRDSLRYAVGSAVRQLSGVSRIVLEAAIEGADDVRAVLEGAVLGAYSYTEYRSKEGAPAPSRATEFVLVTPDAPEDVADAIERASTIEAAAALVKDLVNMPPSDLYPESFATAAVAALNGLPVDVTVWDDAQLAADGFGGILGVGQGSVRKPRLVRVDYFPAGSADSATDSAPRHIALVGKGITFDSGGLSLKPPVPMVGMKTDMAGAATVLGVLQAAAHLGLNVHLTGWLCLAENMPSGSALRPNDVITIRGGRTVEVLNTDAEGRLVMADGLAAASEEYPDAIIDIATLTGASVVALGNRYAGLMGADDLVAQVREAAERTGELFWPMPLPADLRSGLASEVADIANVILGNSAAGMLVAGVFLQEFVGTVDGEKDSARIPWAHLDIAGPSRVVGSPYAFNGKGATAVSLRALLSLAEGFGRR